MRICDATHSTQRGFPKFTVVPLTFSELFNWSLALVTTARGAQPAVWMSSVMSDLSSSDAPAAGGGMDKITADMSSSTLTEGALGDDVAGGPVSPDRDAWNTAELMELLEDFFVAPEFTSAVRAFHDEHDDSFVSLSARRAQSVPELHLSRLLTLQASERTVINRSTRLKGRSSHWGIMLCI